MARSTHTLVGTKSRGVRVGILLALATVFAGPAFADPGATTLVVFGATGDLSGRLLTPALMQIASELPAGSAVLGAGSPRAEFSGDETFAAWLKARVLKLTGKIDEAGWKNLAGILHFQPVQLTDAASYQALKQRLSRLDEEDQAAGRISGPRRVIFYYAIAPALAAETTDKLAEAGLIGPHTGNDVVPEKPLGTDQRSAGALVHKVVRAAGAEHVYFMDHYNGKPGISRLRQLRSDPRFAEIWNKHYIEHIEVRATESLGVAGRGTFYDPTGATRDMVQSHLLQALTFATMAKVDDQHGSLQDAKIEFLKSLAPFSGIDGRDEVRGQYRAGTGLTDYTSEPEIRADSSTETYVKLRLRSSLRDFKNVPITVETGKALEAKRSEVLVHFRRLPPELAVEIGQDPDQAATLRIALDSGDVELGEKPFGVPGSVSKKSAYANQLLNIVAREHASFPSAGEIEAAWKIIDPLEKKWSLRGKIGLKTYKAGTLGPGAARRFSWKSPRMRLQTR